MNLARDHKIQNMLHKHHSSIACLVLLLVAAAAVEAVASRQLDTPQQKKAAQHTSSTFKQLSYQKALSNSSCHGFLIGVGTQKGRALMPALLAGDINRTHCSSSSPNSHSWNVLCAGGTTALWAYIADKAHAHLRVSSTKELGFWDNLHAKYAGCRIGDYLQLLAKGKALDGMDTGQGGNSSASGQRLPICEALGASWAEVPPELLAPRKAMKRSSSSSVARLLPSSECRINQQAGQITHSSAAARQGGSMSAPVTATAGQHGCLSGATFFCMSISTGSVRSVQHLNDRFPCPAGAGPDVATAQLLQQEGPAGPGSRMQAAGVAIRGAPAQLTLPQPSTLQPFYHADITPRYMFDPAVPPRVRSFLPEARIIVMLRGQHQSQAGRSQRTGITASYAAGQPNYCRQHLACVPPARSMQSRLDTKHAQTVCVCALPVLGCADPAARAVSNFNMWWQKQSAKPASERPKASWSDMLAAQVDGEITRLSACFAAVGAAPITQPDLANCLGLTHPYSSSYDEDLFSNRLLAQGLYAEQLQRWFALFPAKSFLIWVSEDFRSDTPAHMQDLVRWLGLDMQLLDPKLLDPSTKMKSVHARRYEGHANAEVVARMRRFFEPHNARLFELLDAKGFGAVAARLRQVWSQ